MELVSEYPLWLILLCLLLGIAYASALYYRARNTEVTKPIQLIMAGLRFLAVAVISFLLLSPLVKRSIVTVEKPIIIIGVDNSSSLIQTDDSAIYQKQFPAQLAELTAELQKKYEVQTYSFGDGVKNGFNAGYKDKETDISGLFGEVESRFANRNVGAMILASDGIYNKGTDPYYAAKRISFPVYTIALGDTTLRKDILIRKITCNKSVFIGDNFPVEVLVEMDKCAGQSSKVKVSHRDQTVFTTEIMSASDRTMKKVSFMLDAKSAGLQRYSVQLDPVEGEINKVNNRQDFFIEVLDARQKVAILYDSPHPDISALEQALSTSSRFEVSRFRTDAFKEQIIKYDLIILNQVPSVSGLSDLSALMQSPVSLLFILGSRSDLNAFNNIKTGLIINSKRNDFSDALPSFNPYFSRYSVGKDEPAVFGEFPPLLSPFGVYQYGPLTDVLFYQRLGNVTTTTPLIMFFQNPSRKIGVIAGENLWRWRVSDYVQKGDHEVFDGFVNKIVQYLAVKEDKSFFRLRISPKFNENEPVEIDAEVFNPSYEMVNDQDVNITITDEQKNIYPFVFSKSDKAYFLKAGLFPVGNYSYAASVVQGKITHTAKGTFTVMPVNAEAVNLVADHRLLARIAAAHNAEMVQRQDMKELAELLRNREDIHSVSYTRKKLSDLIGTPWLFLIILGFLTAEWVLRKRSGI